MELKPKQLAELMKQGKAKATFAFLGKFFNDDKRIRDLQGQAISENRLLEILPDGLIGESVKVPLNKPFTNFMTATVRAGSRPAEVLDVLGTRQGSGTTISFARIKVH